MSSDLAAWLLADGGPIAEDERWATDALTKGDWNGAMGLRDYREPVGQHIARWNPARVLAECAAKRQIVAMHAPVRDAHLNHGDPICRTCGEPITPGDEQAVQAWPCPTLLTLAQPYAGRPGWRGEWATSGA